MLSTDAVPEGFREGPETVRDHRRRPVSVAGRTFASLREACAHYQVRLSTYFRRRRAGHTLEQALGIAPITEIRREHLPSGIQPRAKPVTVQGVTYPSKSAAMTACGVDAFTCYRRLKSGWTFEQALGLESAPARASRRDEGRAVRPLVVAGVTYASLSALARAHGVSTGTLSRRLKNEPDRPLEELVSPTYTPVGAGPGRSVLIAGVRYASLAAACRAHAIDTGVFHARRRSGWTEAQALGVEPRAEKIWPSQAVELAGVMYASMREACAAHGLEPSCVNSRLANGWSREEAFGLVPRAHKALTRKESQNAAEQGVLIIGGRAFRWKP